MINFWDERYQSEEYIYGKKPNRFFEETIKMYNLRGTILLPAEGEGRNAVFVAKKGLKVTCFDSSIEGQKKALKLAALHNVNINYSVGEFSEFTFKENTFDVIALIYAHFDADLVHDYHNKLIAYLKPNGYLILEGFSKKQRVLNKENATPFGPQKEAQLFSIEEIQRDFSELETLYLKEEHILLKEGTHHYGKGAVIRYIGIKTKTER